ncbi:MAG: DUF1566 domain-containing protein [Oleispira sp.]
MKTGLRNMKFKGMSLLISLFISITVIAEEKIDCDSYYTINYPDRYIVNEEQGTVIDRVTGLMWDRCHYGLTGEGCAYLLSDPTQLADPDTALHTVANATPAKHIANTNQANDDNYRGYNDWYMPNIKELAALADAGCVSYYLEDDKAYMVSQPDSIFPLLPSLYKTHNYDNRNFMISSTPADRLSPGARLGFSLSVESGTDFFLSGVVGLFEALDLNNTPLPSLFTLKLVRKVKKSEFKTALTPATVAN